MAFNDIRRPSGTCRGWCDVGFFNPGFNIVQFSPGMTQCIFLFSGMLFPGSLFVNFDRFLDNIDVGNLGFLFGQQSQGRPTDDDQGARNPR
jgi:hypothetical protein